MGLRSSLTLTVPHLFLNTGRSVRLGGQILSPGSRARTRRRPPQAPSPGPVLLPVGAASLLTGWVVCCPSQWGNRKREGLRAAGRSGKAGLCRAAGGGAPRLVLFRPFAVRVWSPHFRSWPGSGVPRMVQECFFKTWKWSGAKALVPDSRPSLRGKCFPEHLCPYLWGAEILFVLAFLDPGPS